MKRTLSLILSLLMVLSLFTGLSVGAQVVIARSATLESGDAAIPQSDDAALADTGSEADPADTGADHDLPDTGAEPDLAETGASYQLWLGSTQVTDANKNDILGDGGKAKFDPSTNTLTLNNPTISGEYHYSKIFCSGFDLTLKGSYTMTSAQSDNALTVFDHDLTLEGNFIFLAWCYAIEASCDININSGIVIAKLKDGDSEPCQALCSDAGSITFGDNLEYFEAFGTDLWNKGRAVSYSNEGTVTVSSKLKLTAPEGGSFKDGSCIYYEGTKQKTAKTVILEPANPSDIKYDVWVGATQVTGANKNDILGDGGKAKYDPSAATLMLNNPTISTNYSAYGNTYKIYANGDLTVKGSYTMTSYAADYGIDCYNNLTLDGNFTFLGSKFGVNARYMLTINGTLVGKANSTSYTPSAGIKGSEITFGTITRVEAEGQKTYGIYAERGLSIPPQYEVSVPAASYIENGTVVDNSVSGSTVAKRVVITPVVGGLGIFLGEKQVTESNKSDVFGDGKASYDTASNTLTLDYPNIRGCYTMPDGKTCVIYAPGEIEITGSYNSISYGYNYGIYSGDDLRVDVDIIRIGGKEAALYAADDMEVYSSGGKGVLTARAQGDGSVSSSCGVCADGYIYIKDGFSELIAEGTTEAIRAGGQLYNYNDTLDLITPEGGVIINGHIYQSDRKTLATKAVFKPIKAYDLWLGGTRVTEKNLNDILNDGGKAKFDPATNTLTLDNPTISGAYFGGIYAEFSLTVKGSYHMTDYASDYGIEVEGNTSNLTLDGDFTFLGESRGIYVNKGDIVINGGSVTAHGGEYCGIYANYGDIVINGGSVTAHGGESTVYRSSGIYAASGSVTVNSDAVSVYADGRYCGIFSYKDITINGGSITAESTDTDDRGKGIFTSDGDIEINGGNVTAKAANGDGILVFEGSMTIGSGVSSVKAEGTNVSIRVQEELTINGGSVTAKGTGKNSYGIYVDKGKMTVGSGVRRVEVEAEYLAAFAKDGFSISSALAVTAPKAAVLKSSIYESDGETRATYVLIERAVGTEYNLWLGTTQVNDGNKDDILGDGCASFNSNTNTLTLNNPIFNSYNLYGSHSVMIYARDMDLTIKGRLIMTDTSGLPDLCINVDGGKLTLNGDFVLKSNELSVYSAGTMTLAGGSLVAEKKGSLYYCMDCATDNIVISSSVDYVEIIGKIYAEKIITIQSPLRITEPSGGKIIGGKIYQSDGTTEAYHVIIENTNTATILGDVDGDGEVTIIDATYIQRVLADLPVQAYNAAAADTDRDGEVTILDATNIQRYIAGLSAPAGIGKPV